MTGFPEALITSFGYRYGPPTGGEGARSVIDLRTHFKRNPHSVKELRDLTGLDPRVGLYLCEGPGFARAYQDLVNKVIRILEKNTKTGIWLGCHGGQHRSVYLAERLGKDLGIEVHHRDLGKLGK